MRQTQVAIAFTQKSTTSVVPKAKAKNRTIIKKEGREWMRDVNEKGKSRTEDISNKNDGNFGVR